MSSLVCGLDVHKDSIYATVMNYGGEIVDKRKLTNDEVVSFLGQYLSCSQNKTELVGVLIPRIHYEQRKSSDYQNEAGPMTELFVDADDPEVEVRRLM